MRDLIINVCTVLNLVEGFVAGSSTTSSDQIMIDHKGKRYMVTFEELCNDEDEEMYDTMSKYWR